MSFKPQNYSPYWKQFSEYIRFDRAKGKCEKCGIENGGISKTGGKVCLTVAHLDFDDGICQCKLIYGFKCAKSSHVLALCNSCHLNLDRPYHVKKRRENLIVKKDSERGLFEVIK